MAMATVRFHRLAAAEYRAALAWYHVRSEKAAWDFRDEIRRAIQLLETDPARALFSKDLIFGCVCDVSRFCFITKSFHPTPYCLCRCSRASSSGILAQAQITKR